MSDSTAKPFVLEMLHLSKSFPGVKALDDVTFEVRPGSVHALMGENGAGKSTLMKCLFGIYRPDSGQILIQGKEAHLDDSRQALAHGVSMIHQELQAVLHRSVMENLWLGRYPKRSYGPIRLVDHEAMYHRTRELFDRLNIDIDPRQRAMDLSVSKLQSMEIAKAVSYSSRIIIMDEPTSSLTSPEVKHLFQIISDLKRQGAAIIYISHRMEEILAIADEVTIMRDGKVVGTFPASGLTTQLIITKMVGRDITQRFPARSSEPQGPRLQVEDLTSAEPASFENVSFELGRGEILGIGGLVGAQRTELVEAIFGLRPLRKGRIVIAGKTAVIDSPTAAKRHRLALVTEDRRATGVFPVLSVADNTVIASLRMFRQVTGLLDEGRALSAVKDSMHKLNVKAPSPRTPMGDLSGGNQQKVIFGRWLLTDPEILILDEPTRGIDVGAKFEIYTIIAELAARGTSILLVSSDMPELLGMSDRILVMCEGRVTGIVDGRTASQEQIMTLATQVREQALPLMPDSSQKPVAKGAD
jgi:methyl-galactoside transport system ATP-binding protein